MKRPTRKEEGVTLIELIVVMAIIMFVMIAASRILTSMIGQFKQQTKIAETFVESVVGLEFLRNDLREAGFGLHQGLPTGTSFSYEEVENDATLALAYSFNDAPSGIPRAIIANQPAAGTTVNSSDYLVIKSQVVGNTEAGGKFHFLDFYNNRNIWNNTNDNLDSNDRVIVLFPQTKTGNMLLKLNGTQFSVPFGTSDTNQTNYYTPSSKFYTSVIYGVDSNVDLIAPFNRADYYITDSVTPYASNTSVPERCAPGTGVLVKSVMDHDPDGADFDRDADGVREELPLMDCVLDMQVIFRVDTDENGVLENAAPEVFNGATASVVRKQLKEVRVYVLSHEGQRDPAYTYPDSTITVGEWGLGRDVNLSTTVGANWAQYRWKLYTLVVLPESMNPGS